MIMPRGQELMMPVNPLFIALTIIVALALNMLPWGGPLGRVATVLEMDAVVLWRDLIVVQAMGLAMLLALAVFLGLREQRRIRLQARRAAQAVQAGDGAADAAMKERAARTAGRSDAARRARRERFFMGISVSKQPAPASPPANR